jgi:hypothetical protein
LYLQIVVERAATAAPFNQTENSILTADN